MPKIIFECEIDIQGDERIEGLSFYLKRSGKAAWLQELLFMFSRPQRVREGKILHITQRDATVVKVGEQANTEGKEVG